MAVVFHGAVVKFDQAVSEVEVAIVVADGDDGFAAIAQLRQQLRIKEILKGGVLVSRPFIKQVNRAIFQVGSKQGEALALPLGQRSGGKLSLRDGDLLL